MVLPLPCQSSLSYPETGPISTVSVLGQGLIIHNDARIAFDLLEKKSAIYSDQPDNGLPVCKFTPSPSAEPAGRHRL